MVSQTEVDAVRATASAAFNALANEARAHGGDADDIARRMHCSIAMMLGSFAAMYGHGFKSGPHAAIDDIRDGAHEAAKDILGYGREKAAATGVVQ